MKEWEVSWLRVLGRVGCGKRKRRTLTITQIYVETIASGVVRVQTWEQTREQQETWQGDWGGMK